MLIESTILKVKGHESGAVWFIEDQDGYEFATVWTQYWKGETSNEAKARAERKAKKLQLKYC